MTVEAARDQVDALDQVREVLGAGDPAIDGVHLDARVVVAHPRGRALGLGQADVGVPVEELPGEVTGFDAVLIDQRQFADAEAGQALHEGGAAPADAEHQDVRFAHRPLEAGTVAVQGGVGAVEAEVGEVAFVLVRVAEAPAVGVLDQAQGVEPAQTLADVLRRDLEPARAEGFAQLGRRPRGPAQLAQERGHLPVGIAQGDRLAGVEDHEQILAVRLPVTFLQRHTHRASSASTQNGAPRGGRRRCAT